MVTNKKFISLVIALLLILSIPFTAFAQENENKIVSIEYFDDGSYLIVELVEEETLLTRATSSKPGSKSFTYYNSSDEPVWKATLNATFTYTGSSATCTSASVSYKIYDDAWKCTSAVASKSGRTARGDFVFKKYVLGIPIKTIEKSLTISCSNTGTLS